MTLRSTIFADAFTAIGLPGYVFNTTADEQADAARQLDAMMEQWEGEGIVLGYTPTNGEPEPDLDMTTPTYADKAISLNLALSLAPSFGKQPLPYVKGAAKKGYGLVVARTFTVPVQPINRVGVIGGGDWWRRWLVP